MIEERTVGEHRPRLPLRRFSLAYQQEPPMTQPCSKPPSRIQFSIRLLLVATAAIAAAVGAVAAEPSLWSMIAMTALSVIFLTVPVIACFETVGRCRAVWVGVALSLGLAAAPTICMLASGISLMDEDTTIDWSSAAIDNIRYMDAGWWAFAPINGLIAVLIHWLFFERRPTEPAQ
jgi:hypothetical protein